MIFTCNDTCINIYIYIHPGLPPPIKKNVDPTSMMKTLRVLTKVVLKKTPSVFSLVV